MQMSAVRCWGTQATSTSRSRLRWRRKALGAGYFFFSSRRRHTRCSRDWSSDVCSSDLIHFPPHLLVNCVRKVYSGERWVEKRSAGRLLEKLLKREVAARQLAKDLTVRELDILRLVAMGLSNKAIAERIFVKEGTVKIHLHNIYKKLDVGNRLALTIFAQNKGFV